jgi:SOS response regulatory protein OraA/RecX
MPPPVITKYQDGSSITGVRDVRTDEEIGTEEMILTAANMGKLADLRRYEERLRAMKATRTGRYKSASLAAQNRLAAAQNKLAAEAKTKAARIKAKRDKEAREKESQNIIRNLLSKGLQPSEIRRLYDSFAEVDRNHRLLKYVDEASKQV